MDFKAWVLQVGGIANAAAILDEKERTVRSWFYGERSPGKSQAANIVKKTKGKVDYNGIFSVKK